MKLGQCHICGMHTALTFEHVPPRSAFNNRPIRTTPFEAMMSAVDLDDPGLRNRGPVSQRGAGAHTLCATCNNNTGAWYGNAFVDWSYQGLEMVERAKTASSIAFIFQIFPLRVVKQVLCMFFSANPPNAFPHRDELVRFVLNRDSKYLRPDIRIYAALSSSNLSRQSAISGQVQLGSGRDPMLYSEIAFPPLTYLLSVNSRPPDERLVDISFFSASGYNEWKDVVLRLPVLPVYTPFPGDYRSREQTIADRDQNIRDSRRLITPDARVSIHD